MIVAVEEPSAAGKTTWCARHGGDAVVPEYVPTGREPRDADPDAQADSWAEVNTGRWAAARSIVKGHADLNGDGHEFCAVADNGTERWWPPDLPVGVVATGRCGSGQGGHPLPGEGLGQADAFPAGLAQVCVVDEPVDCGGSQGLGHEFVEAGGVQVRRDRDAAAFVGGVDEPVEAFGGVGSDREQPDVVDDHQVGPQDPGDGFGDRVVRVVAANQDAEGFEGEPGDVFAGGGTTLRQPIAPRRAAGEGQGQARLMERSWDAGHRAVMGAARTGVRGRVVVRGGVRWPV